MESHVMIEPATPFSGGADVRAGEAIREAIETLGYLTPDSAGTISTLLKFCPIDSPRTVAAKYRQVGPQVSATEKRALGLRANAFLSQRAFNELTDKGRTIALRAHEVTLLRVIGTHSRMLAVDAGRRHGYSQFQYAGMFNDCRACRRLNRLIVGDDQVHIFPPEDCDRESCIVAVEIYVDFSQGLT